jgi:hypothetical protein
MAGMLQSVSCGQRVTLQNIVNAFAVAILTIYPGKTGYGTALSNFWLGHYSHGWVYCIRGESNGNASIVWLAVPYIHSVIPNIEVWLSNHMGSSIVYAKNVNPSKIHKDLKISPGELKILVECSHYYGKHIYFPDGRMSISSREAFKFLVLTPKVKSQNTLGYFNSIVIFTPKPGLFDETPPM